MISKPSQCVIHLTFYFDFCLGYLNGEMRQGPGVAVWPNGDRYEGQWLLNKLHGFGKFLYSNGDYYKGMW